MPPGSDTTDTMMLKQAQPTHARTNRLFYVFGVWFYDSVNVYGYVETTSLLALYHLYKL